MPTESFYVLTNDATGTAREFASLDAALDAVDLTVGDREHWEIHEFLSDSVARWVIEGSGRPISFEATVGR